MPLTSKYLLNVLILVLCGILTGAYLVQYLLHENPCPLCILQRLGMLGVASGALMNLQFGIKARHYGVSLLSAIFGGSVSIRQILLHICPDFPTFGTPIFGLSLYTWAFIAFACSAFVIACLLFLYEPGEKERRTRTLKAVSRISMVYVLLLAIANFITTLMECGIGSCAS